MPITRENIKTSPKYRQISHLLRRAGFGATPGEMDRYMGMDYSCLLYTSPSPRDATLSRMPSSA